jgi:hypothetical protein
MARKKTTGPKTEKKVTRYTYDEIKEPRTPETGHTSLLPAEEFLRRFLLHVVPRGFMRIRHYGILANAQRDPKLARSRELLGRAGPSPAPQAEENPAAPTGAMDPAARASAPPAL